MNFPKILVALDRSTLDNKLIQYSRFIAKKFGVNSIQFTHVVPFYIAPNLLDSSFENLIRKDVFLPEKQQKELAKGRSGLAGFVFGSVTEKLLSIKDTPPVLVVW